MKHLILNTLLSITLLFAACTGSKPSSNASYNANDFKEVKAFLNGGNPMHFYIVKQKTDTASVSAFCKSVGYGSYFIYIENRKSVPYFAKFKEIKETTDAMATMPPDYVYFNSETMGGYYTMNPE